jgi:membrane protease YdiL (CAAX protease family)
VLAVAIVLLLVPAVVRARYGAALRWPRLTLADALLAVSPLLLLILTLGLLATQLPSATFSGALRTALTTPVWLLPALAYGVGEELGWRAYLQPELEARLRPREAALLLGGLWLLWHAPFFAYRYAFGWGMLVGFALSLLAATAVLRALYVRRLSVWLPVAFHTSMNVAALLLQQLPMPELTLALLNVPILLIGAWLWWRWPAPQVANSPVAFGG